MTIKYDEAFPGTFFASEIWFGMFHFTILMLLSSTTWRLSPGQPGWGISQAKAEQSLGLAEARRPLFDVWQIETRLILAGAGVRFASWAVICNTLSGSRALITCHDSTELCTNTDQYFTILSYQLIPLFLLKCIGYFSLSIYLKFWLSMGHVQFLFSEHFLP